MKIPFLEFHSSANLKSYFRSLEIHVQNFSSLSLLATYRQACKISTDNGSTAVLTISQQCAGFKLFCIFQFKHIRAKIYYPKNLLSKSTLHLAPVSFLKSCILYLWKATFHVEGGYMISSIRRRAIVAIYAGRLCERRWERTSVSEGSLGKR